MIGEFARRLCDSLRWSVSFLSWWLLLNTVGYFRVHPGLCIKTRLGTHPFLWKWVLFAWEWKIISIACSISKVEHLTSFWYRGPGELENGLLACDRRFDWQIRDKALCARGFFSWLRRSCRVGLQPTKQPLVPRVAGHYKDLTETGNRARKVSGTQGKGSLVGA